MKQLYQIHLGSQWQKGELNPLSTPLLCPSYIFEGMRDSRRSVLSELAGVFHLCQGETSIPALLGFLFGGSILLMVGTGNILS